MKIFLNTTDINNPTIEITKTKFFKSYKDANNFIARNMNIYKCKLIKLHKRDIYINNIDNYKVEYKPLNK